MSDKLKKLKFDKALDRVIRAASSWADDLPEQEPYDDEAREEKEKAAEDIGRAIAIVRKGR